MTGALWLIGAYLVGAIPTSYLAARLGGGLDLREHGSKNVGATNLYRVLGLRFALPVGLVDMGKGLVPTLLAPGDPAWLPLAVGSTAVVGHVFPVFLGFRGGKGVATAAGVVLALAPIALAISAAVWLVVVLATKFVSLGSLLGAASFPLAVALLNPGDPYLVTGGIVLALFIVWTHRSNIRRLLQGTENRVGRPRREPEGSTP